MTRASRAPVSSPDDDLVFTPRGDLSSHLSKLEQAGYVEIEKTFRGKIPLTICRLTAAGRSAFERYRETRKKALAV